MSTLKTMKLTETEKRELFLSRYTRKKYTEEERIQFFKEGKHRVPTPVKNKKKYDRNNFKKIREY